MVALTLRQLKTHHGEKPCIGAGLTVEGAHNQYLNVIFGSDRESGPSRTRSFLLPEPTRLDAGTRIWTDQTITRRTTAA